MAYEINQLNQSYEITPVSNVVVTSITQDTEAGDYYREIRVMAIDEADGVEKVVITLRLRGATSDDIEVDVPASQF